MNNFLVYFQKQTDATRKHLKSLQSLPITQLVCFAQLSTSRHFQPNFCFYSSTLIFSNLLECLLDILSCILVCNFRHHSTHRQQKLQQTWENNGMIRSADPQQYFNSSRSTRFLGFWLWISVQRNCTGLFFLFFILSVCTASAPKSNVGKIAFEYN